MEFPSADSRREFVEVRDGIWRTPILGLLHIRRTVWKDDRGSFTEVCRIPHVEEVLGVPFEPQQINHSISRPGVIRGIHAEGWNKLVHVVTGTAFCVWVDLRHGSETFLHTVSLVMDESAGAVYVPVGVGNSFGVIGECPVHYLYVVDKTYDQRDPIWDRVALNPFDPELGISWPIKNPTLSERDARALSLREMLEVMKR